MLEQRPDWNTYFLGIAEAVAQRADCTRSKVGAVLVNSRNEIRGTGYNGSPAGLPGCLTDGACPRGRLSYDEVPADSDYSNCVADHAERNALRHSRPEDLKGATLYVTRPPCPSCTTLINACGIVRVVSPVVNRCLGCGEYEGDGDDNCVAQYEGHGSHVYTKVDAPKPECVHSMRAFYSSKGLFQGVRCTYCEHRGDSECDHSRAHATAAMYSATEVTLYKYCPDCKARFTTATRRSVRKGRAHERQAAQVSPIHGGHH